MLDKTKREPTAFELKEEGNKFYSQYKYDEALSAYTKAIVSIWLFVPFRFHFNLSTTLEHESFGVHLLHQPCAVSSEDEELGRRFRGLSTGVGDRTKLDQGTLFPWPGFAGARTL